MPIVTIHLLEGRDKEKKKALIKNVSEAIVNTLDVPLDSVRVILQEMSHDHFGIGGLPVQEYWHKNGKDHKK